MTNKIKTDCVKKNCTQCIISDLNMIRISPFECDNNDMIKLFSYFLHQAPNIESIHSKQINNIKHPEILDKMFSDRHYRYQHFCAFNTTIEKETSKAYLNEDTICLKCKRYVCKKKKPSKNTTEESDLVCFLRHIRNSIAHGHVYYNHAGNRIHIVFEDFNGKNLSARIVCIKSDLEYWKRILSTSLYYDK